MDSYSRKGQKKSVAALVFLTLIGIGFLFFGLVAVTCGFIINYLDDFEATDGGIHLEARVESQFDYSQYWLGFPFLIAAVLSVCSAQFQTTRSLTTATTAFFFVCIILSLFAMVLEGVDWITWKNMDAMRRHWEDKDGVSCSDNGTGCTCINSVTNVNSTVSSLASCSNITTLSGLFGAITASAIIGIFLSLAGIVVILKTMSWKPRHYLVEYDLQKNNPVQYKTYKNDTTFVNGGAPRLAGTSGSIKEIPMY